MDKLHLLEPSTIFLEFGAGRGKFMFIEKKRQKEKLYSFVTFPRPVSE